MQHLFNGTVLNPHQPSLCLRGPNGTSFTSNVLEAVVRLAEQVREEAQGQEECGCSFGELGSQQEVWEDEQALSTGRGIEVER